MKKGVLLSRSEMKNVMGGGGNNVVAAGGCATSNDCPTGTWCCENMNDLSQPMSCLWPVVVELGEAVDLFCPA